MYLTLDWVEDVFIRHLPTEKVNRMVGNLIKLQKQKQKQKPRTTESTSLKTQILTAIGYCTVPTLNE